MFEFKLKNNKKSNKTCKSVNFEFNNDKTVIYSTAQF